MHAWSEFLARSLCMLALPTLPSNYQAIHASCWIVDSLALHTQSVFPGKAVLQQCLQNLWLHGAAELGKGSEHAAHDSGISCCYASSDGLQVLGDGFQQNHPHSALPVAHWHQQVDIDWLDYNIYSLYFTMIIYIYIISLSIYIYHYMCIYI